MIKKLILVVIVSIFLLTGCQPIQYVDLNKMILNNLKVTSSQNTITTSLELTYNKANVQDPSLLKVIDLLNHAKLEMQVNVKGSSTASLSGNVILSQGKIPFQLYVDDKEMIVSLDNMKSPIRIPVTVMEGNSSEEKVIQDIQTKLLEPTIKNLPNPKHLSVRLQSEKIHGTDVSGYSIHEEIYVNEVPQLLIDFIDNLLKDDTSVSQIVSAVNELNKDSEGPAITPDEFKSVLQDFKTQLDQLMPELQNQQLLDSKSNFKADLFVDKKFFVRKSIAELNIKGISEDSGLGISGIRLKVDDETWNINGPVNVEKINSASYLNQDVTPDQFLATLDKKTSVLYSVIGSFLFEPSKALEVSQVSIKNNPNQPDTVTVRGLAKGDVVKVYKAATGGDLWAAAEATGSSATMSINQLGKTKGNVYISIIRANEAESNRLQVGFAKEVDDSSNNNTANTGQAGTGTKVWTTSSSQTGSTVAASTSSNSSAEQTAGTAVSANSKQTNATSTKEGQTKTSTNNYTLIAIAVSSVLLAISCTILIARRIKQRNLGIK